MNLGTLMILRFETVGRDRGREKTYLGIQVSEWPASSSGPQIDLNKAEMYFGFQTRVGGWAN